MIPQCLHSDLFFYFCIGFGLKQVVGVLKYQIRIQEEKWCLGVMSMYRLLNIVTANLKVENVLLLASKIGFEGC
jgi:hypothetical protein